MLVYLPTPCTYITKSFNVMKMMRWNEPATLAVKVLDVMLRQDIEFHQRRWSLVCWLTLWCGWHVNKRRGKKFQMTIHSLLSPKQWLAFCIFLPCWLRKMLKGLMTSNMNLLQLYIQWSPRIESWNHTVIARDGFEPKFHQIMAPRPFKNALPSFSIYHI